MEFFWRKVQRGLEKVKVIWNKVTKMQKTSSHRNFTFVVLAPQAKALAQDRSNSLKKASKGQSWPEKVTKQQTPSHSMG